MKTTGVFRWGAAVCLLTGLCAAPVLRAQYVLDGFNPDIGGSVSVVAVQPDGRILIGGLFTNVSGVPRTNIARLHVDGRLDTDFNPPYPQPTAGVTCMALQGDGKILVGGSFSMLGGQPSTRIARLHPDGSLDTTFNPNVTGVGPFVSSLLVQADGKILIGGYFTSVGGVARTNIARVHPNGTVDVAFRAVVGGLVASSARSLALQADGKILVGGEFTSLNGQARANIGRLHADGRLDTAFNPGAVGNTPVVDVLEVQPDGRILVAGRFSSLGGQTRTNLGRLNANGSLDMGFNAAANDFISCLALQGDGKILLGGIFTTLNGQTRSRFGRLNADGSLDTEFNPTGAGGGTLPVVSSLAVQADGKILIGGSFPFLGGAIRNALGRISPYEDYDSNSGLQVNGTVNCAASLADGTIWVGGFFLLQGGVRRTNLFAYNPNINLVTPASTFTDGPVTCLAIQADGKVLVGGDFTRLNGQPRSCLGRLNANGSLDTAFNPGVAGGNFPIVHSLAVQKDGKILVGGDFITLGGQSRTNLGRLHADGTVDNAFNPGANPGIDQAVQCLAVQPDGKILAGTRFFAPTPGARIRFGRLNANGSLDAAFNPQVAGTVWTMALQPDGKILVGGFFGNIGGVLCTNIGRLNPNGSLDTTFKLAAMDPSGNNYVNCLALQADGKVLLGGRFTTLNGIPRNRLGRLNADGSLDMSFDAELGGSNFSQVHSLAVQSDGKILVGGSFTSMGGQPRTNFARLTAGYAVGQSLRFEGTQTVVWKRSGAGPEFSRVTFEGSFDGVNYLSVSEGIYTNGAWRGGNARLAQGLAFFLRGRGRGTSGRGNGSASIVEVTRQFYLPGVAPVLASSIRDGTDLFQLSFPYTSGIDLNVLATTNVAHPRSNWISLGPAVEFAPRQYQFADPATTNLPRRFYRVSAP